MECTIAQQLSDRDSLLSVQEVALLLNISEDTVTRYHERGILPGLTFGSLRRFDPRVLGKWLQSSARDLAGTDPQLLWTWQGDHLVHHDGAGGPDYRIDEARFRTIDDLQDWIQHLARKRWITKSDLVVLVARFLERFNANRTGASAAKKGCNQKAAKE